MTDPSVEAIPSQNTTSSTKVSSEAGQTRYNIPAFSAESTKQYRIHVATYLSFVYSKVFTNEAFGDLPPARSEERLQHSL